MTMSSPLSELMTMSSPSETYFLAKETQNEDVEDITDASSPGELPSAHYRDIRPLALPLQSDLGIQFDEEWYITTIHMLNSLLCAGASRTGGPVKPASIPPAKYIALLSTVAVHPLYTSNASVERSADVASQALAYLRNLVGIVGPLNANLATAFHFRHASKRRGVAYDDHSVGDYDDEDEDEDGDHLKNNQLATSQSVWQRVTDFWSILGWAFNCAALHPRRWRHWKAWLEFMFDVMEADWNERKRQDEEAHERSGAKGRPEYPLARGALLLTYAISDEHCTAGLKWAIKAMFCDGSPSSTTVFPEVFRHETKGPAKQNNKRKRGQLDLDNDKFGDYFDDDESLSEVGEPSSPTRGKGKRGRPAKADTTPPAVQGLLETVSFKWRLFELLSDASYSLPEAPINMVELYEAFCGACRNLPIPLFSAMMSTWPCDRHPTQGQIDCHSSLRQQLLQRFLPSSARKPASVDPETAAFNGVSVDILVHCHLPYSANTVSVEDNAKLSLILESMFQILWTHSDGGIPYTEDLRRAVETGISARESKVKQKKRTTARGQQARQADAAKTVLDISGMRLTALTDVIQSQDLDMNDPGIP